MVEIVQNTCNEAIQPQIQTHKPLHRRHVAIYTPAMILPSFASVQYFGMYFFFCRLSIDKFKMNSDLENPFNIWEFPIEHERTKPKKNWSNWLIKTRINTFELNLLIEPITERQECKRETKKMKIQRSFQNHYKNKHRHRWRNIRESIWEWTL